LKLGIEIHIADEIAKKTIYKSKNF